MKLLITFLLMAFVHGSVLTSHAAEVKKPAWQQEWDKTVETAKKEGFKTMSDWGKILIENHVTSKTEVERVTAK